MSATAYPQVSVLQLRAELAVNPITKPLLVGHIGMVVNWEHAPTPPKGTPALRCTPAPWLHVPVSKLRFEHVRTLSSEEVAERERGWKGKLEPMPRVPRWVGEHVGPITPPVLQVRRLSMREKWELTGEDLRKYVRLASVLAEWRNELSPRAVGPMTQDPTVLLIVMKAAPGPTTMATINRLWSTARPEGVTALRIEWTQV